MDAAQLAAYTATAKTASSSVNTATMDAAQLAAYTATAKTDTAETAASTTANPDTANDSTGVDDTTKGLSFVTTRVMRSTSSSENQESSTESGAESSQSGNTGSLVKVRPILACLFYFGSIVL